jgi:hypothetical protein
MLGRLFKLAFIVFVGILLLNSIPKWIAFDMVPNSTPLSQLETLNQIDQNTNSLEDRFQLNNIALVNGCTAFDLNGSPGVFRFARHCDGDTKTTGIDGPQYVMGNGLDFELPPPRLGRGEIITVENRRIVRVPISVVGFRNGCAAEFDVIEKGNFIEQGNSGSALIQDGIVRGVLSYGYSDLWPSRDGRKRSSMGGVVFKKCQL